jgi:hypothetical protein
VKGNLSSKNGDGRGNKGGFRLQLAKLSRTAFRQNFVFSSHLAAQERPQPLPQHFQDNLLAHFCASSHSQIMFEDVIPLALIAATALLILHQRDASKDYKTYKSPGSLDCFSAESTIDEKREDSLADKATVLAERLRMIGPNTALSYGSEPLMMLHGRGAWLYDEHDRPYLDCVNNVAHVGHCHPKVKSSP